jgi:predicted glycosyltransferase
MVTLQLFTHLQVQAEDVRRILDVPQHGSVLAVEAQAVAERKAQLEVLEVLLTKVIQAEALAERITQAVAAEELQRQVDLMDLLEE